MARQSDYFSHIFWAFVFHICKIKFDLIIRFYDIHSYIKIYDSVNLPFIFGHAIL